MKFITLLLSLFILFIPQQLHEVHFKEYRVVLDPGHGGQALFPMSIHGDKYDPLSKTYLTLFREGATYGKLVEHEVNYRLAEKVFTLLSQAAPGGDFIKFKRLLLAYGYPLEKRIYVIPFLSRKNGISRKEAEQMEDPNGSYRLYDYTFRGMKKKGRISYINSLHPHLVLSLHAATAAPRSYTAINPVLCPPWSLLEEGRKYIQEKKTDSSFFSKSSYTHWLLEDTKRNEFQWFLSDTWQYFTGYPLKKDGSVNSGIFRGLRYNMVTWKYRDPQDWVSTYRGKKKPWHERSIAKFKPGGKFFKREGSLFERYRREGGQEGFGGDNAYASYEIIRYILFSLQKTKGYRLNHKPGKPYFSIWSLPLHVNAVTAYLEIGYFNRKKDRVLFNKYMDEVAEGIAVGIYSLFTGFQPSQKGYRYMPKGKRIDFSRYITSKSGNYFLNITDNDKKD